MGLKVVKVNVDRVRRVRVLGGNRDVLSQRMTAASLTVLQLILYFEAPLTRADELPEIRKNIEQGFKETQKTVNKWITNFTKKLDGEPDEYDQYGNPVPREHGHGQASQQRQNFGPSQSEQLYGIRKSAETRRSADHNRYDADNRVLGDDFAQLELRDNEGELTTMSTSARHALTP